MQEAIRRRRVVVMGGGHGVTSVLRAVRDRGFEVTVVVTVADDGGSSGELRRRWGGPAVGDVRRSLIALVGDESTPARTMARRISINRFGEHPLGNLLLRSLSDAFGDLEAASEWLAGQLGITGRVLPATSEPVTLSAEGENGTIRTESAIATTRARIRRLHFEPGRPAVPSAVIDSIRAADWVVLAPGSLFTSVLAVSALPDVGAALARTRAEVVWICNLEPDRPETAEMTAADHLAMIRSHGVRIDTVLYDPDATLRFTPEQLLGESPAWTACPLRGERAGLHDPILLGEALEDLFARRVGAPAPAEASRSAAERIGTVRTIARDSTPMQHSRRHERPF